MGDAVVGDDVVGDDVVGDDVVGEFVGCFVGDAVGATVVTTSSSSHKPQVTAQDSLMSLSCHFMLQRFVASFATQLQDLTPLNLNRASSSHLSVGGNVGARVGA